MSAWTTHFHVAPRLGKEVDYKICENLARQVHWRHQILRLRRSRYVAREFSWLSPDREDLF